MKRTVINIALTVLVFGLVSYAFNLIYSSYYESDFITISLEAKYDKNDKFQVFYHLKKDSISKVYPFNSSRLVTKLVSESENFQIIEITIPSSEIIDRLRIDYTVGSNNVEVRGFKISRKDITHSIQIEEFDNVFSFSKYTDLIVKGSKVIFQNKKTENSLDPHFIYSEMGFLYSESSKPISLIKFGVSFFLAFIFYITISQKKSGSSFDFKKVTIATIFVIFISAPGLKIFFNTKDKIEIKNHNIFSREFKDYLTNNFGFREFLLDLNTFISIDLFNVSPNPRRALIGKSNWFFYSRNDVPNSYFSALDDYLHINLLKQEDLKRLLLTLEDRNSIVSRNGGVYFKFVYPNKASIYPEYLPKRLLTSSKKSRLDQVVAYFEENKSTVEIIDLKGCLISEKSKKQLYYKFDSHWNSYGAFVAYQYMEDLFKDKVKGFVGLDFAAYQVSWEIKQYGDLLNTTNIKNGFLDSIPIVYKSKNGFYHKKNQLMKHGENYRTYNNIAKNNLKVVVFRDSYTNHLYPFISESFSEVYYVWNSFNKLIIESEKPDIVIDGFIERAGIR